MLRNLTTGLGIAAACLLLAAGCKPPAEPNGTTTETPVGEDGPSEGSPVGGYPATTTTPDGTTTFPGGTTTFPDGTTTFPLDNLDPLDDLPPLDDDPSSTTTLP